MAFSKRFHSSKETCDWSWSEKTSIECRSIVRNPLIVLEHVVGLFLWLSCPSCVFAVCVSMIFFMLTCDLKGGVCVFLCNIRGLQRWGTGWVKQSSGGVKRNNAGAPGPCVRGHLAWDAPALCNSHLCGVTSKSRCFWERLGQMAIISFLSSASIWCLSIPPRNIEWGRARTCMKAKYERGHTNVNTKANRERCDISSSLENGCDQITYSSFTASCSRIDGRGKDPKPSDILAILMSSAVRIKAMSVELKWTVLSSATGRSMRSSLCRRINQEWAVRKMGSKWSAVEPPGDVGGRWGGGRGSREGPEAWMEDSEGAVHVFLIYH